MPIVDNTELEKCPKYFPRVYVYETAGPGALAWLRSCWERVFFGPKQYELEDLGERGLAFRCTLEPRLFGPTTQQEEKALAAFKQAWEILRAGWAKVLGNLSAQERENAPRYFDFLQLKTILPIYAPDGRYIEAWQALYELSLPLAPAQDSLPRPPRVLLEGEYLSLELRGAYLAKAVFAHLPVQARRSSDLFAERFAQPAAMLFKRVNGRFLAPFFMGENGASPACKEAVAVGGGTRYLFDKYAGKGGIIYLHYLVDDYDGLQQGNISYKTPKGIEAFFEVVIKESHFVRATELCNLAFAELGIQLQVEFHKTPKNFLSKRSFYARHNYGVTDTYLVVARRSYFDAELKRIKGSSDYFRIQKPRGIGIASNPQFVASIALDGGISEAIAGNNYPKTFSEAIKQVLESSVSQLEKTRQIHEICSFFIAMSIQHESLHPKIDRHPKDDANHPNSGGHIDFTVMDDYLKLNYYKYDAYMIAMLRFLHGSLKPVSPGFDKVNNKPDYVQVSQKLQDVSEFEVSLYREVVRYHADEIFRERDDLPEVIQLIKDFKW